MMDILGKNGYDKKISDSRLAALKKQCPECGAMLTATGSMYHSTVTSNWLIEYWCPEDKEMFYIWNPENESLTTELAKLPAGD